MFDLRNYELHQARQQDLQRIAQREQYARNAQNGKPAKRNFQALLEDFRHRLSELAQHI